MNNMNSRFLWSQMDSDTQQTLANKLKETIENNFIVILGHAKTRSNERKVNKKDLIKFLKLGQYRIIELNIKEGSPRCLIRTKAVDSYEIVASVCVNSGAVVTCWTNHVKDNHATLNMEIYNKGQCQIKF